MFSFDLISSRDMKIYLSKSKKLAGNSLEEVTKKARLLFRSIERRTKRRAYIRAVYFNKEKIFLEYFWPHLNQKHRRERLERLRYLPCAMDLVANSRFTPTTKESQNSKSELLHRFTGVTDNGEVFCVQIKEDTKTGQKFLMSIFKSG